MKLLMCKNCSDIFNLSYEEKVCSCGQTKGNYLEDGLNAVYSGNCIPIGFSNPSFIRALFNQPREGMGEEFTAFVIPKECNTFKKEL